MSRRRAATRTREAGLAPWRATRRECLATLLAAAWWPLRGARAAPTHPNILFIMIDTLRADHVGCYGYPKDTTPHLDRLAREGVRFATFHTASPWTMPSVVTMLTSLPPSVHGATSYERRASLRCTTLAERLKRLGYQRTVGIVGNPTVNSRYGFAQGFDLYDDYTLFFAHELNLFQLDDAPQRKSIIEAVTAPTLTRMAIEWLEQEGRRGPWFLFLLYFDPHNLYVPPHPWDARFDPHPEAENRKRRIVAKDLLHDDATPSDLEYVLALYDGEIGHTDHCIGRLIARLDALGLGRDTLVLVTSDHGEEFLDHGGVLHGRTLYQELTRGICILRHPGSLPAGRVVTQPACHLDIAPTLLDYIGEPPDAECHGLSLLPQARPGESDGANTPGRPCFLEGTTGSKLSAIVRGRHKLIRDLATGREQLYDLQADSHEQRELSAHCPDLARELSATLRAQLARSAAAAKAYQVGGATPRPRLTRRDIEALRALGYLQ